MSLYINNGALGAMAHTGAAASALALSVPAAAGALLLKTENLLGIGATLMLLTALALAFLGGAALARLRPLRNRPALAILRYGFLCWSAAMIGRPCWRASSSAVWGRASPTARQWGRKRRSPWRAG